MGMGMEASGSLTYTLLQDVGSGIVTGRYQGRPFPNEAALATQYGISRSIVREAVKMLSAKGLLHSRPRIGIVVQPASAWNLYDSDVLDWLLQREFSLKLLRQFTELRLGVEPQAASLAATAGGEAEHQAIRTAFARMEAASRGKSDALEADIGFHAAILRATGNPFFLRLQGMVTAALRVSIRFTNRIEGRTADLAEHGAVLHAIEQHDAAAAAATMRTVIGDVLALILRQDPQE